MPKLTKKEFEITPFGVDLDLFNPNKKIRNKNDGVFIVGTVKALSDKYGISYILKAVSLIRQKYPEIPIQLRIAGKGPQEQEYKELAEKLMIQDITTWLGFISQENAAIEWANMDIAVIPSESESFGVSAVEAQACGVPVIISDIPGLMEATKPEKTSFVVHRKSEKELADAIVELYKDDKKRQEFGVQGRKYVEKMYELHNCFIKIENLYIDILTKIDL